MRQALEPNQVQGVAVHRDELFRRAFEHAPIGIALVSQDKRWLTVNTECCTLLGCPGEALIGQPVDALVIPEDRPALARLLDVGLELGEREMEIRYRKRGAEPNDAVLTFCARASSFTDESERRFYILQLQDISLQKQAEAELQESEVRYRLLAENTSDLVGLHAPDGKAFYVSPSSRRLLGMSPEELLGVPAYTLTHPEDVPRVRAAHERMMNEREPASLQCRLRHADGHYLWCEFSGVPVLDASGRVMHFQTTTRDISQRMADEQALQASEAKFRAILDAQPDAVLHLDGEGYVLESNPAADALFGYGPRELIGRTMWLLLSPRVAYDRLLALLAAQPGGVLWEHELEGQRKDGSRFPAELTAVVLPERGYLWMLRDTTARERARSALAEAQERLVQGREEERLHIARELHDGPVQDLIALSFRLAELARSEALPAEVGRGLEGLKREVVEVVKQVRGTISELRPADFDEFGFAASLEGYLTKLARHHPKSYPDTRLRVIGDLDSLSAPLKICLFRVVQEAMSNVVRHAEASSVQIRLERLSQELSLLVSDDGQGFAVPETLSELTRRDHFGLAGIAERVKLMGGTLVLRSQRGHGSELSVSLPIPKEHHAQEHG